MRIVVLTKPVPDPASAGERLGPDGRLDRAASPGRRQRQRRVRPREPPSSSIEAAGEGEVIAALDGAGERPRDACARPSRWAPRAASWSPTRRSQGSARWRRRASSRRRSRRSSSTWSFAGRRHLRRRRPASSPAGVAALDRPAVPLVRRDDRARRGRRTVRVQRITADRLRRPRGADAGRSSAARRRSASRATRRSRGSWRRARRRSRRCRWPTSASTRRRSGCAGAHDQGRRFAAARAARRDEGRARGARRGGPPGRRPPRRAEAHLMAGIWVHRRDRRRRLPGQAQHRGRDARPDLAAEGRAVPTSRASSSARRSGERGRGARELRAEGPDASPSRDGRSRRGRRSSRSGSPRSSRTRSRHHPGRAPARKAATWPAPCPR